jgi:hypothetical protein
MTLIAIECRRLLSLEQNKNHVNSWLHGAVNGARSVIANFEGGETRSAARDDGRCEIPFAARPKKPATGFPARA